MKSETNRHEQENLTYLFIGEELKSYIQKGNVNNMHNG